jgi:calcineurin-like phosphoesterase family protein
MIDTLYDKFKPWSAKGSIYIISDTHFEDADCKLMDKNWISPQEHIDNIKKYVHKNDTLIHLGDVGNPEWMAQIKAHKVLIMGNHDAGAMNYGKSTIIAHNGNKIDITYFDEIYTGPLFIAEKILLSHEPIINGSAWFNIHGHDHNKLSYTEWRNNDGFSESWNELNLAANVVDYKVYNLGNGIKNGLLSYVDGVHRLTIDRASRK